MGILKTTAFILLLLLSVISLAQENGYEYERGSLHVMLLYYHTTYEDNVKDAFRNYPFPERFNNHDLGAKTMSFFGASDNSIENIKDFCQQVNLGQKMVAKWFNRDKTTGSMNMELIKERGLYNATQTQQNLARASMRGMALLEDAGENLIKNTYLVVNDIQYTTSGSSVMAMFNKESSKLKGFSVEVTSYLFRLKWDKDMADAFYNTYYTENGKKDRDKVEAFMRDGSQWQMAYVGKTYSKSSKNSRKEASLTPRRLLEKITTRALDLNLAQLQHDYPEFRIKAPLVSTDPLKAYVGLKEDITPMSKFEVLERVTNEEGKVFYNRVGTIRPIASHIWDNRYMADDEDADAKMGYTEFEKVSGGPFSAGMLIREIK